MSSKRVELLQQMKQSELRYLRAMKDYLAEQKALREELLALEGAQDDNDSEALAVEAKNSAEEEEEAREIAAADEEKKKEEHKRKKEEEEAKEKKKKEEDKKKEEEAKKKKKEEEESKKKEEEKKKKDEEEQKRKKKLEEEAQKRKLEDEEKKKKKEEEKAASKNVLSVAASSPVASSPVAQRRAAPTIQGGEQTAQQLVYQRLTTKAAQEESTATESSNKEFNKTPKSAVDAAAANEPGFSVLDLTGNTVFSMKKREYCELIGEALKTNTHIHTVKLAKCTLDANDAKSIASGLATNDSVELLDLSSNKINNDGAKAIALALRSNTRLTELNLLGQPSAFGDSCLEEFVALFNYNVTLTKIIWRLDSRKSFAINKLLVRNNTIMKWLSESKDVSSLVPSSCNIPELAALAANELHKARSVSSAPRLVPFEKKTEVEAEAAVVVEPSQVDDAAPDEAAHAPSPTDAWWLIDPSPNGSLEDDGRTLLHNGGEEGGGACISVSNLCFSNGVLEFTVVNAGETSVLVGVTDASPESIDKTDATKNKQRYVCSFFNGKVFGPDISFHFLEACGEISVRLDLDEKKLYFAADGGEFGDAAFENLPDGLWRPYFALGHNCSITCI